MKLSTKLKNAFTRMVVIWNTHGTKILGGLQGTIAAVAGVTGIIPDKSLKYWLGVSALLTFWRGFVNSKKET